MPTAPAATTPVNPLAARHAILPARAKRVIYLHMSGAPPQHDLYSYKPKLNQLNGTPCPAEILNGERFAFIRGTPKLLGSPHKFSQHGQCGAWMSDQLPNIAGSVDDMAIVNSMFTDQFNHAPAEMLLFTGNQRAGYRVDGIVGDLWPRLGKRRSARLCCPCLRRHRSDRRQKPVGQRIFAIGVSGRAVPKQRRTDSVCLQSCRHGPRRSTAEPRRPARISTSSS